LPDQFAVTVLIGRFVALHVGVEVPHFVGARLGLGVLLPWH
jgi:hypothetical protein